MLFFDVRIVRGWVSVELFMGALATVRGQE